MNRCIGDVLEIWLKISVILAYNSGIFCLSPAIGAAYTTTHKHLLHIMNEHTHTQTHTVQYVIIDGAYVNSVIIIQRAGYALFFLSIHSLCPITLFSCILNKIVPWIWSMHRTVAKKRYFVQRHRLSPFSPGKINKMSQKTHGKINK